MGEGLRCGISRIAKVGVWVLAVCALTGAMSDQLGTRLVIPSVGRSGIFDPSVADTPRGQRAWMSYSAVNPSARWPENNKRVVSTRLAYSDDAGATWHDIGYPLNAVKDVEYGSKASSWSSEVSSLVYDPYASSNERWKLFWHHYLYVEEKGQFQNGWVAYKAAPSPEELRNAREIKLFGGIGYNKANNLSTGETASPVAGAPIIKTNELASNLRMCIALSEPGAMATKSGLYLAAACFQPKIKNPLGLLGAGVFGFSADVVLLKCDAPCRAGEPGSWKYVSTPLPVESATAAGFRNYSAPDLFMQNGRAYLIASPVTNSPYKSSYNGCQVFRFSSLATGELEQENGRPRVIQEIHGRPNSFNGACTYQPGVSASGFIYSQLNVVASAPYFEIYQSGIRLKETY